MTLREWREANPAAYVQPYSNGALQVFTDQRNTDRWGLHHLTDYVASSSVSGLSIILVPITERS